MVQSHLPSYRNLGNFITPHLPMSFGRDTKSRWSLLSGVYAMGSKRSHTGGKCVDSEVTIKAGGPFYLVSMPWKVKDPTQGVNV